jgi:predicted O-methyltransferase YrrM
VNIRPLTGSIPIDTGGWSLSAETCERLVHEIMEREPHTILECGSGASTALMATCLKKYNIEGQVFALDHKPQFARATRRLLARHKVEELATVVTAPLVAHAINGDSVEWYDFAAEEHLEQPIDLLLVDGPPGSSGPMARWPAVPLLKGYLATDGLILLDDGDRPDERASAQDWAERLGAEATLCGQRRPYWVLDGQSN